MNKNIIIVLLTLLVFLVLLNKCDNKVDVDNTSTKDTLITYVDTIKYIDTSYVEIDTVIPRYVTRFHDSIIYNIIDTSNIYEIAREYFSQYHYDDTIVVDSSLTIRLQEVTFMNLIQDRSMMLTRKNYKIKEYSIVENKFRKSIYIGAQISGSEDFLDAGPYIGYIPNEKWILSTSYGLKKNTLSIYIGYKIY